MKKILIYTTAFFLIVISETSCRSHKIANLFKEITKCQGEIRTIEQDTVLSKSEVGRILVADLNHKIDRDQDELSKLLDKASPTQITKFYNSIRTQGKNDSVNQDTSKAKTKGKLAKIPNQKTGSGTDNQDKNKDTQNSSIQKPGQKIKKDSTNQESSKTKNEGKPAIKPKEKVGSSVVNQDKNKISAESQPTKVPDQKIEKGSVNPKKNEADTVSKKKSEDSSKIKPVKKDTTKQSAGKSRKKIKDH